MVTAVGRPRAISSAKPGPESAAGRRRGKHLRDDLGLQLAASPARCPWRRRRPGCRRECRARALSRRCASPAPARARITRSASRRLLGSAVTSIEAGASRREDSARSRALAAIASACARVARDKRDAPAGLVGDERERRAEGAGAGDDDALEVAHARAPFAAARRPPARRPRRAASGRGPADSDRAEGRRRAAPLRPRRSSRRCRCRALAAARRRARRVSRRAPSAARGSSRSRRRRRRRRARSATRRSRRERCRARRACGPRRRRRPRPGTMRQRSATSFSDERRVRLGRDAKRRLQSGEGEVAAGRALQRTRQRRSVSGRPSCAARSTFGPPG